jgi:peptidoglycan/LPS O-acetylase OafA/YrhL
VRAKQVLTDTVWASFFGANIRFANTGTNYFAQGQPPSPVQHFWSLAVEEQFYVVWPTLLAVVVFGWVLVRVARRRQPTRPVVTERALLRLLLFVAAIMAASLFWSIRQTRTDPTVAYFSTFTRAWELALGAGLAIAADRLTGLPGLARALMGWVGLAAIFAAAILFNANTAFPGSAALLPTAGAALLIAAGIASGEPRIGVSRVLSIPPLRYIGDRSYTFYLWHWPVLVLAEERYGPLSTSTKLLLLLAAFALSIVTYRLYENPIHRGERWQARGLAPVLWLASPVIIGLLVVYFQQKIDSRTLAAVNQQLAAQSLASVPGSAPTAETPDQRRAQQQEATIIARLVRTGAPLPAVTAAAKAADAGAAIPTDLSPSPQTGALATEVYALPAGCSPGLTQSTSRLCRLGDAGASKILVVFGDSHAQMWMPAILSMARKDGYAVVPIIKESCTIRMWGGDQPTPACAAWLKWALPKARALHPDTTLIAGRYQQNTPGAPPYLDYVTAAYQTMIHTFRQTSQVVVMGDVFGEAQQPVDCLLASHPTMDGCSTPYDQARIITNNDVAAVASRAGAGFINTEGWFCAVDRCATVIGKTVAYFDSDHITQTYAGQLSVPFRDAFAQALSAAKHP